MPPARLPVYLALDCSGSMVGDGRAALGVAVSLLADDLRADPYAEETVWAGVVTFASVADQAVPLTPVADFHPPPLEARGSSPLGEALTLVADCLALETTADDFRPVVFVATDGEPTDKWQPAAKRLAGMAKVVLLGAGRLVRPSADFPGGFVRLQDATTGSFREFLDWVPGSVRGAE